MRCRCRPNKHLGDEIRRVVKSVYGDEYDAAPTNSCEAALWITFDALLTPPLMGRGEPYRARCIGLIERHAEHHLSYGRPFPPKYKDLFADRGATAGELGLAGRRSQNTDIVMVPMAGARLHTARHQVLSVSAADEHRRRCNDRRAAPCGEHPRERPQRFHLAAATTPPDTAAARRTATVRRSC